MRLVFESVDSVKEAAFPMWWAIGQSVEGLNRTKRFFFFLLELGHFISSSPALGESPGLGFVSLVLLVLRPPDSARVHHWFFWGYSLHVVDCGTSRPPNHVSQLVLIPLRHPIHSVSLENPE